MVVEIEGFRNEIEPPPFAVRNVLHDAEIDIDELRRPESISTYSERA